MTLAHHGLLMSGGSALDSAYLFTATGHSGTGDTLLNGGQTLQWAVPAAANGLEYRSSSAISGKTYCEFACILAPGTMSHGFGVQESPINIFYSPNANGGTMFTGNGGCGLPSAGYQNGGSRTTSASYSFATNDRIGIAFDPATLKLWFSKNGTWISGDPAAGTGQTMTLAGGTTFYFTMGAYSCSISSGTYQYNIYPSLASMLYSPPSGFSPYQV